MPTIKVPPAYNYPNPLVGVPATKAVKDPPEGPMLVNCEIDWGTTDNGLGAVHFNLTNNATLNFSQIGAIIVDNSQCGADVTFVWLDTNTTVTIPAYAPYEVVPVFTNNTEWYVVADDNTLSTDVTRFSVLNYQPMPTSVSTSQHQNLAAANAIPADGATGAVILAAGNSGTVEAVSIFASGLGVNDVAGGTDTVNIVDGNNNVIATSSVFAPTNEGGYIMLNLTGLNVRFTNGLRFTQNGANIGGRFAVSLYYRTP